MPKQKKKTANRGHKIRGARQSVQAYMGVPETWPVREKIKHEIFLMPNRDDIATAEPRNPLACALHNAAVRIFGVPNAVIGAKWAYIPQRDENGNYYIAKVAATEATRAAILKFDKTGEIPVGGFRFIPMAPGNYLETKRKYAAKRRRQGLVPAPLAKGQKRRKLKMPLRMLPHIYEIHSKRAQAPSQKGD